MYAQTHMKTSRNKKGQHCLPSAKTCAFWVMKILRFSDDQAFGMFTAARWGSGEPVYPVCGMIMPREYLCSLCERLYCHVFAFRCLREFFVRASSQIICFELLLVYILFKRLFASAGSLVASNSKYLSRRT